MVVIYFIYSFIKRKGVCVFTDKKYIKYASIALVPIMAINTYVGYKIVKVEDALDEMLSNTTNSFASAGSTFLNAWGRTM